jgi:hypothetical protein
MKVRLSKLAEEQEVDFEEALKIATEKLPESSLTGKGKNTWVNEQGAEILSKSLLIDEIIPKHYEGIVMAECPNPRYNYVISKEIGKKVAMMVPRTKRGILVGKKVTFEAIEDIKGISYRYVQKRRYP